MSTLYALIDESNIVANVILWDGNTESWQPEAGVRAVSLAEGSPVGPGWTYDGIDFTGPLPVKPTADEILASNTATRDSLLMQAALAIAPLQDAVDLDEASDSEIQLLKLWKQYRVAVNRTDLTRADPTWPAQPA